MIKLIVVLLVVFDVVAGIANIYTSRKLMDINGAAGDNFGSAVAINKDTIVVGSHNDDEGGKVNVGSINIYSLNGNAINLKKKRTPSDGKTSGWFGISVSLNTDYIIVGSTGSECVHVYNNKGGTPAWVFKKIVINDGSFGNYFGQSVGMNKNNELVVGAPQQEIKNGSGTVETGSVYMFSYNGSEWKRGQTLVPSGLTQYSTFGCSVAITTTNVAVGAKWQIYKNLKRSGSVYIYKKNNAVWEKPIQLASPNPQENGYFGNSVSMNADRIVIGAYGEGTSTGKVYVYVKDGDKWKLEATLKASDGKQGDNFGFSVSIYKNTIVVGAYLNTGKASKSGSAYAFKLIKGKWTEYGKLLAGDGKADVQFGYSVSIFDGDKVVVGSNNNGAKGIKSGAAYFYNGLNVPSGSNRITGISHEPYFYLFICFMYLFVV